MLQPNGGAGLLPRLKKVAIILKVLFSMGYQLKNGETQIVIVIEKGGNVKVVEIKTKP